MNLPHITQKQQTILTLLYTYRFLERKHIQLFLDHTNKSRVIRWLKDLREKQYIDWIYDADNSSAKVASTPATYYLSVNGIRSLRQLGFPDEELRKRYKDDNRRQNFISGTLLLADCVLHLEARNRNPDDPVHYNYGVEASYLDPESEYPFLAANDYIRPSLVFTKSEKMDDEALHQTYFVELFDMTTPRYMVKKKIKGYIEYLQSEEWDQTDRNEDLPIILIACPTLHEMINAKRYAKKQLNEIYDDAIPEEVIVCLSTLEKVRLKGVTAVIWEDV